MLAYIIDNKIKILSKERIEGKFLSNISDYKIREYSDEIKNPILQDGEIIEILQEETEAEKFLRIFDILKNAENLEKNLLEGIEFNDEQIGDLILHRVFGGNPHAESAMQAKVIAMILSGKQDENLLAEVMQKKAKINEIRVFFGLAEI